MEIRYAVKFISGFAHRDISDYNARFSLSKIIHAPALFYKKFFVVITQYAFYCPKGQR